MSRKLFYISILVSTVIFFVALGLSQGIHILELLKRAFWGLALGALAGAAAAPSSLKWLPKADPYVSGWGMDPTEESSPRDTMIAGAMAVAAPTLAVFMLLYSLFFPFIEPGYILRVRLSDEKLVALASMDEYTYGDVAEKYRFSMDGKDIGPIANAAVCRMRSPDKIREAAVYLGVRYRPVAGDVKSAAFLKAISRLDEMRRQDLIARVYYGLKEHAKDRGIGSPIAAMLKIIEISSDKKFIEGVVSDITTPPEVRSAAEVRLKALK